MFGAILAKPSLPQTTIGSATIIRAVKYGEERFNMEFAVMFIIPACLQKVCVCVSGVVCGPGNQSDGSCDQIKTESIKM